MTRRALLTSSTAEITDGFLGALTAIDKMTALLQPPYIIKVTPTGHVEQIYPEDL